MKAPLGIETAVTALLGRGPLAATKEEDVEVAGWAAGGRERPAARMTTATTAMIVAAALLVEIAFLSFFPDIGSLRYQVKPKVLTRLLERDWHCGQS